MLGSRIAFQTAFKGYDVAVYDINDEALDQGKNRMMNLKVHYHRDLGATDEVVNLAYNRMSYRKDLKEAFTDAETSNRSSLLLKEKQAMRDLKD